MGAAGVWESMVAAPRRRGRRSEGSLGGVWDDVVAATDVTRLRPRIAGHVEYRAFVVRGTPAYGLVENLDELAVYRIPVDHVALLDLMDGSRTVQDLAVEHLRTTGELRLSDVVDLVELLHGAGCLAQPYVDAYAEIRAATADRSTGARVAAFLKTLTIEWAGADRAIRALHRGGLRFAFNPFAVAVGAVVALAGFAGFVWLARSERYEFADAGAGEAVALVLMGLCLTMLHELGHGVYLVHHGRRVKSAGFLVYFGSPAFFIESSDGLMLDRRRRIMQSFAGPYAEMVVAGALVLVVLVFPDSPLAPLLYAFAVLNYVEIFLNLVPLLELDGYWILTEVIEVPDLRPRSLTFVRRELWVRLARRQSLTRSEAGLSLYGVVGVAFTVFSLYVAAFFWWRLFGGIVRSIWGGGTGSRLIFLVVLLVIAGPVLRAALSLVRAVVVRIRQRWADARFRLEKDWRIEAALLIDQLPLRAELSEEALSDLAGRVRRRHLGPGEVAVRQGDPADAFYVVRRGSFEVVELGLDGRERMLRTLGPGEAFGEIGLLQRAARGATVRAAEPSEVFELGRSAFEIHLAPVVERPAVAPTVQAVRELRSLDCFEQLEEGELVALAQHGSWVTFEAGAEIIREGDVGDAFYAIADGRVEVRRGRRRVREQGRGSYFGELALLHRQPRTASVTAVTFVRLFRLPRREFTLLLRSSFRRGRLHTVVPLDRTWTH
jgi:CRP-like cAMP-binding protein/Zn-dependent protease